MGFFSFKCAKSNLSIPAYPAAKLPRAWSEVVMVLPDNKFIEGVYDGYGNIDGKDIYAEIANVMFGKRDRDLIFNDTKIIKKFDEYVGTIKKFNWDEPLTREDIIGPLDDMNKLLIGSSMNDIQDAGFEFSNTFKEANKMIKIVRLDIYNGESFDELETSKSDPTQGYFYEPSDIAKLKKAEKENIKVKPTRGSSSRVNKEAGRKAARSAYPEEFSSVAPDEKDIMRLEDMVAKANGDEKKLLALATQMSNAITDSFKAHRRASAATAVISDKELADKVSNIFLNVYKNRLNPSKTDCICDEEAFPLKRRSNPVSDEEWAHHKVDYRRIPFIELIKEERVGMKVLRKAPKGEDAPKISLMLEEIREVLLKVHKYDWKTKDYIDPDYYDYINKDTSLKETRPEIKEFLSQGFDHVVVSVSGGKDSTVLMQYAVDNFPKEKIVCVHAVIEIDHKETIGVVEEQCRFFDLPLVKVQAINKKGEDIGFLDVLTRPRMDRETKEEKEQKFPDMQNRWCTSILKIGPINKYCNSLTGNIVELIGERARESTQRSGLEAIRPVKKENSDGTTRKSRNNNTITKFSPILEYTEREVWAVIRAKKIPEHPCYGWGFTRASCAICIFSGNDEIVLAAKYQPEIVADYIIAESKISHTFKYIPATKKKEAQTQTIAQILDKENALEPILDIIEAKIK